MLIRSLLFVVCTHILKISCQPYTNLVWSILTYRCFNICSAQKKFHEELGFLEVFLKIGQLLFIDNCFKTFDDQMFIKHPQLTTVEKKTLFLSLPYLGKISLQTRTKLRKSFKDLLNSYKIQLVFISQRKLSNIFRFKDRLSSNQCLEQFINIRVVDAILPIMVRRMSLKSQKILRYHLRHLRKLNHQRRAQFATIF